MTNIKTLYTTYKGRIPRSVYWFGLVGMIVASILVSMLLVSIGLAGQGEPSIIELIVMLGFAAIAFALYIKRFHDMGKSGWFSLLLLIPIVNLAVAFFWLGFVKGTDGDNAYGADPLAGAELIATEE